MATMTDVAKLAGVSVSTVSYALSGTRPIKQATKERVLRAIEQLDYQPNLIARGLAGGQTRFLALLLPIDESPADPFMSDIIVAAAEAAREREYHLLLWTESAGDSAGVQDLIRRGLIDGALLLSVRLHEDRVTALRQANLPLMLIGRTQDPSKSQFVDSHAEQAAEVAIAHLAKLGHKSVAYIGPPQNTYDDGIGIVIRMHESLINSAAQHNLGIKTVCTERNLAASTRTVADLLSTKRDITALLALDDLAITGVLTGLRSIGRAVPTEVSVVGLLSSPQVALMSWPEITTVSHDPRELGRLAALAMIDSLEGTSDGMTQVLLPSKLTQRSTTAPPPSSS